MRSLLKSRRLRKSSHSLRKKTEDSKVSVNGDMKTSKGKKNDATGTETPKIKTSDDDDDDSSEEESDEEESPKKSPSKKVKSPIKKEESKVSVNGDVKTAKVKKGDITGTKTPKMKTSDDDDDDSSEEESVEEESFKKSPLKKVQSPTKKEESKVSVNGDVKTAKLKKDDTTGIKTPKMKTIDDDDDDSSEEESDEEESSKKSPPKKVESPTKKEESKISDNGGVKTPKVKNRMRKSLPRSRRLRKS